MIENTIDKIISMLLYEPKKLCIIVFSICLLFIILDKLRDLRIKHKIKSLADEQTPITPTEFFDLRKKKANGKKYISTDEDFQGVYILYNETKKLYYVGQSIHVLKRVNAHFTGKGNGDVYADYKYGDNFIIRMIELQNSGFSTLNQLERHAIKTYNAYTKGYNKNRGNK